MWRREGAADRNESEDLPYRTEHEDHAYGIIGSTSFLLLTSKIDVWQAIPFA